MSRLYPSLPPATNRQQFQWETSPVDYRYAGLGASLPDALASGRGIVSDVVDYVEPYIGIPSGEPGHPDYQPPTGATPISSPANGDYNDISSPKVLLMLGSIMAVVGILYLSHRWSK